MTTQFKTLFALYLQAQAQIHGPKDAAGYAFSNLAQACTEPEGQRLKDFYNDWHQFKITDKILDEVQKRAPRPTWAAKGTPMEISLQLAKKNRREPETAGKYIELARYRRNYDNTIQELIKTKPELFTERPLDFESVKERFEERLNKILSKYENK